MNGWPWTSLSISPSRRAHASVFEPAANGTTIVTRFTGHLSWADALGMIDVTHAIDNPTQRPTIRRVMAPCSAKVDIPPPTDDGTRAQRRQGPCQGQPASLRQAHRARRRRRALRRQRNRARSRRPPESTSGDEVRHRYSGNSHGASAGEGKWSESSVTSTRTLVHRRRSPSPVP